VRNGESTGEVVIGKSGSFDFGDLPPGNYDLTVTLPEKMRGFRVHHRPFRAQHQCVDRRIARVLLQLL
jgi:hypothetical protein